MVALAGNAHANSVRAIAATKLNLQYDVVFMSGCGRQIFNNFLIILCCSQRHKGVRFKCMDCANSLATSNGDEMTNSKPGLIFQNSLVELQYGSRVSRKNQP